MTRFFSVALIFLSFVAGAIAQQTPAPAAGGSQPAPGEYSGTLQEWAGAGSSDVKMTIRNITGDGRVTGSVQATHALKFCLKRLPMSGIVLPEGRMRLEVNAGAPEGCERIYHVKVESGTLSGDYIDAVKARDRKRKKA